MVTSWGLPLIPGAIAAGVGAIQNAPWWLVWILFLASFFLSHWLFLRKRKPAVAAERVLWVPFGYGRNDPPRPLLSRRSGVFVFLGITLLVPVLTGLIAVSVRAYQIGSDFWRAKAEVSIGAVIVPTTNGPPSVFVIMVGIINRGPTMTFRLSHAVFDAKNGDRLAGVLTPFESVEWVEDNGGKVRIGDELGLGIKLSTPMVRNEMRQGYCRVLFNSLASSNIDGSLQVVISDVHSNGYPARFTMNASTKTNDVFVLPQDVRIIRLRNEPQTGPEKK